MRGKAKAKGSFACPPDQWQVVELTRALLAFDTINPPGNEAACVEFLAELLAPIGFDCRLYAFTSGRPSLVAVLPGSGDRAPLCFAGHVDTVPLGSRRWSRDPFAGEIAESRVYGRGASDMKGGVAAYMIACARAAKRRTLPADLVVVVTAGEETGCEGSAHLAHQPGALGGAGALVVAEPTGNYPMVGHKGALWLAAESTGIAAHGSMPELGVNAVCKAARAVVALEDFGFNVAPHRLLGSPSISVGTISGGTAVNLVPDQAAFAIDVRTLPGQRAADVRAAVAAYLGEELTVEAMVSTDAVFSDPHDPWIEAVFDVVAPYLDERPQPRAVPFFTDASTLKPALGNPPTIILGPGETHMAHQTDEYCKIPKLEAAVDIYLEIIERWNTHQRPAARPT